MGVRLLNRTTRSVSPTGPGSRLISRLGPALKELDAAVLDVGNLGTGPAGLLRINVPRIAAMLHIAPILGRFQAAHPRVVLEVFVDDAIIDIVAGRFDAGVRLGERLEKDMVAIPLGRTLETAIVAAPAYLQRHGIPATPRDLHEHLCINLRLRGSGGLYHWELERDGEELSVPVEGPLIVNDSELAVRAALDGVGIAYLMRAEIQPLIAAGRLVRVLEDWSPTYPGFYLYYPSRRQTPPALRALVEFLREPA
ncbi:MAG TPA: LysR substrate-binding domain-containing protein [Steroidobacteraceae bacterium]|nr:LysR substrate-binding domain-containing protein [Steroidobacteraceae bacterium]